MTKLISLVEQKDADGFRTSVEASLAEKVADVLDGLKPIVAQKFFSKMSEAAQGSVSGDLDDVDGNISNTCEPGPGVGQAPDTKGGLSNVQKGSVGTSAGAPGGFKASSAKAAGMPSPGANQGLPRVAK